MTIFIEKDEAYAEHTGSAWDDKTDTPESVDTYMEQMGHRLLTRTEEHRLAVLKDQGDPDAREKLIRHNLRLGLHIAKRYIGKGLPLEDLVQEANAAIIHSVDKFNPYAGTRFTTYATNWIIAYIQRAFETKRRFIRIPQDIEQERHSLFKAKERFERTNGRSPTSEELAELTKQTVSRVDQLTFLQVDQGRLLGPEERFPEPEDPHTPYDHLFRTQIPYHILSQNQLYILVYRFGLDNEPPLTLEETAKALSLSRQRVRYEQDRALKLLRFHMPDDS